MDIFILNLVLEFEAKVPGTYVPTLNSTFSTEHCKRIFWNVWPCTLQSLWVANDRFTLKLLKT